ncbi:MAG: hypothetical protein U0599_25005 [Vicinamibacteria bacterium]
MRIRLSFERPARVSPRILAQDFVAFWRHFRARLRLVLTDPVALGVLVLLGVPSPIFLVGAAGRASSESEGMVIFLTLVGTLLVAPIAALAASGAALGLQASGPGGSRALPVGSRARALADTTVALTLLVAAHVGLFEAGLYGAPRRSFDATRLWLASDIASEAALGALLLAPAVFAWAISSRFDARGFAVGTVVALATSYATQVVPRASLGARAIVIGGIAAALFASVVVLAAVRLDLDWRAKSTEVLFRPSPGPMGQLRKDRVLGATVRLLPIVVLILVAAQLARGRPALILRPWKGDWLPGLQLLALVSLPLFPLGLPLTAGQDRSFWAGSFTRAWAALPLPRESVLRSVWGHAMVTGFAIWVFFVAWIHDLGGWDGDVVALVAIALASVPVLAGVVVCVAAGESRRGGLAIAALFAICALVPVMPLDWGIEVLSTPERRLRFTEIAAGVIALAGGVPPLGLLRRPRRRALAS